MSLSKLTEFVQVFHNDVATYLKDYDPLFLTLSAIAGTYVACRLWHMHEDDFGIWPRLRNFVFRMARKIPLVRKEIEDTKRTVYNSLMTELNENQPATVYLKELPSTGMTTESLQRYIQEYDRIYTHNYKEGRQSGAVFTYQSTPDELEAYLEIFKRFAYSNPLWPKVYPGIRRMESEVIRITCSILNGDDKACGAVTTGGTMSILLACLAHRNKALKKGILFPEMIIPISAHAAFTKAAEVFRIKVRKIPLDASFKVDLKKMKSAINKNTCMLVGSAPNFPFGTIDDITAIGQLGLKYDIPVHVDACLGGFLIPFFQKDLPAFDFSVAGVSSISADTHKYGLAPKGSSVVAFRNHELLHNQYFCDADWQGGIYASATLEGSRSGLNVALCWAALLYQGRQNYIENAEAIRTATRKLRDGIKTIPELRLQGDSDICIVSWTSDEVDINRIHSAMQLRDWELTALQYPCGMHLMLTKLHTQEGVIDSLIADLREAVKEVKNSPDATLEGTAAIYGMARKIPDRSIVQEVAHVYLDAVFAPPLNWLRGQ